MLETIIYPARLVLSGTFAGILTFLLMACSDGDMPDQFDSRNKSDTLRIGFGSCADDDAQDLSLIHI